MAEGQANVGMESEVPDGVHSSVDNCEDADTLAASADPEPKWHAVFHIDVEESHLPVLSNSGYISSRHNYEQLKKVNARFEENMSTPVEKPKKGVKRDLLSLIPIIMKSRPSSSLPDESAELTNAEAQDTLTNSPSRSPHQVALAAPLPNAGSSQAERHSPSPPRPPPLPPEELQGSNRGDVSVRSRKSPDDSAPRTATMVDNLAMAERPMASRDLTTPSSLVVEVGDGNTLLETLIGEVGSSVASAGLSSERSLPIESGSVLNLGFVGDTQAAQQPKPPNIGRRTDRSPPEHLYADAPSSPVRNTQRHPIFNLQFDTPTPEEGRPPTLAPTQGPIEVINISSDQNEGQSPGEERTGEVGSASSQATVCPIWNMDASVASSVRSVLGRIPITRIKRCGDGDPSVYQSAAYHQLNVMPSGSEEQYP